MQRLGLFEPLTLGTTSVLAIRRVPSRPCASTPRRTGLTERLAPAVHLGGLEPRPLKPPEPYVDEQPMAHRCRIRPHEVAAALGRADAVHLAPRLSSRFAPAPAPGADHRVHQEPGQPYVATRHPAAAHCRAARPLYWAIGAAVADTVAFVLAVFALPIWRDQEAADAAADRGTVAVPSVLTA